MAKAARQQIQAVSQTMVCGLSVSAAGFFCLAGITVIANGLCGAQVLAATALVYAAIAIDNHGFCVGIRAVNTIFTFVYAHTAFRTQSIIYNWVPLAGHTAHLVFLGLLTPGLLCIRLQIAFRI